MLTRNVKKSGTRLLAVSLILLLAVAASAIAADTGNGIITIGAGKTVKGPGFYTGSLVQIDGTIDGTTFVAGREVRINGTIKGDLIAAAGEITINGKITGNLYGGARSISINGQVAGDAICGAQEIRILNDTGLDRDALLGASKIVHSGEIKRQLLAAAQNIVINGIIQDNVRLQVEKLELQDKAFIGGNIDYSAPQKALTSENAKIDGKTTWTKIEENPAQEKPNYGNQFFRILVSLAGALLIWFLGKIWRPRFWSETARQIEEQPLKTLGLGALALITTPILVIILIVTIIGLPLGIILALAYGITIYLAKIIAAVFIGYWLAKRFSWPELHKGVWLVLLGLCIITVLTKIPLLGFLCWLGIVFTGLGSIILAYARPGTENEVV